MASQRVDESLDDLTDLWCQGGRGEAEAERYADQAVPDPEPHVSDEKYDSYTEDQNEGNRDCQAGTSLFSFTGSSAPCVLPGVRTCSPVRWRTAPRNRPGGCLRMLARWSSRWLPMATSTRRTTKATAETTATAIITFTAGPLFRWDVNDVFGVDGKRGNHISGSNACRFRLALHTGTADLG